MIDPHEAAIVSRIFSDFAGGASPWRIAKTLNRGGVPSPRGGIWYDATIRGQAGRGDGILRNSLYVGQLAWNRVRRVKDPLTGSRVRKPNRQDEVESHPVLEQPSVDTQLWQRVQERLRMEVAPGGDNAPVTKPRFWERRRPRHLPTGRVVCGLRGRRFYQASTDYVACRGGMLGACPISCTAPALPS